MRQLSDHEVWERHWNATSGSGPFFGRLSSLVRKQIPSRTVRHYARRKGVAAAREMAEKWT